MRSRVSLVLALVACGLALLSVALYLHGTSARTASLVLMRPPMAVVTSAIAGALTLPRLRKFLLAFAALPMALLALGWLGLDTSYMPAYGSDAIGLPSGEIPPFSLLGVGALWAATRMIDSPSPRRRLIGQAHACGVVLAATFGIGALLLGPPDNIGLVPYIYVPLATNVAWLALCVAMLYDRRLEGPSRVIFGSDPAARMTRTLLAVSLVGVPFAGWLRIRLQDAGFIDYSVSVALYGSMATTIVSVTAVVAGLSVRNSLDQLHEAHDRLRELSYRDPLTGIYNRRYMIETLSLELIRARRDGRALSVVMLDLDHFKAINDEYGHEAGDESLRQFADVLRGSVRAGDIVCRYGGEEFVVIMPATGPATAEARAESIRRRTSRTVHPRPGRRSLTVSSGVASYPECADSAEGLMAAADEALYEAKAAGRNRVARADRLTSGGQEELVRERRLEPEAPGAERQSTKRVRLHVVHGSPAGPLLGQDAGGGLDGGAPENLPAGVEGETRRAAGHA